MKHFKAPEANTTDLFTVFLAGSIDMDKAEKWQNRVVEELKDFDVAIMNPRRDAWDASWKQEVSNPKFFEQVDWEFKNLEKSKLIFLYFTADSKAPISLLELGLFADSKKLIVCCPKAYWRHGNVEYICKQFKIPLFDTFEAAIKATKKELFAYGK
jgi:hypothetical protein